MTVENGWLMHELRYEDDGSHEFHVVPSNDLREHTVDVECWCKPTRDAESSDIMICYAHHSLDRREEYEEGRKPS